MTASKMVSIALGQVGHKETGVNHAPPYTTWYGIGDAEWCDIFVSWVADQAGELAAIGGKHASTGSHVDWFIAHKQWGHTPRVGAIVFFDWPGTPAGANHVGIVVEVHSGYIITVEGNEGNKVSKVKRSASIMGYGYPKYKAEPPKAPTPPTAPPSLKYPGKPIALTKPVTHGVVVHTVQVYLNRNGGFKLALDSEYGPKTYAAVRSYQKTKKLTIDGVIGPKTWAALVK